MSFKIISADILTTGDIVYVSSSGKRIKLEGYDGNVSYPIYEWYNQSNEDISSCCVCNQFILCPTNYEIVYVFNGYEINQITLPDKKTALEGACQIDSERVLVGGTLGKLFIINVIDCSVKLLTLRQFNINKPGRDIDNIICYGKRVFLLGKKQLLLEYQNDTIVDLIPQNTYKEISFWWATLCNSDLWLSGKKGMVSILARYSFDSGLIEYFDCPIKAPYRAPLISCVGNQLIVADDEVVIGMYHSNWKYIQEFQEIVAIFKKPKNKQSFVALCSNGEIHSFEIEAWMDARD